MRAAQPETRRLERSDVKTDKSATLVRFMIASAERKPLVEKNERNKVFGIPLEDVRDYAGFLDDYCVGSNIPPLNALIDNSTDGSPGDYYST